MTAFMRRAITGRAVIRTTRTQAMLVRHGCSRAATDRRIHRTAQARPLPSFVALVTVFARHLGSHTPSSATTTPLSHRACIPV